MKKFLFSILCVGGFTFSSIGQAQNYSPGDMVNDFTVVDIHGKTHNLYAYLAQGKYVIMDFFFDTCGPCQNYQPTFNEFYDKYGCNAGDVIAISINNGSDTDAEVIAYENTYGGSFQHAPAVSGDGGSGAVDQDFGVVAYPTTVVIKPDSTLLVNDIWPVSGVGTLEGVFPGGAITPMTCTNISLDENFVNFSVYPNPANENITIDVSKIGGTEFTLEVFNMLGQTVKTLSIESTTTVVSVSELPKGQYSLHLFNEEGYKNQQILSVQ